MKLDQVACSSGSGFFVAGDFPSKRGMKLSVAQIACLPPEQQAALLQAAQIARLLEDTERCCCKKHRHRRED